MTSSTVVRVTGTQDLAEIAAVLAAIAGSRREPAAPGGYERWRAGRVAALRASRTH